MCSTIPNSASSIGKWCWRGDYAGNPLQGYPPSSDSSAGECFEVIQIATSVATAQTWTLQDSATITVASGTLAGTLRFDLYENSTTCATTPTTTTKTISGPSGTSDTSSVLTVTLPGQQQDVLVEGHFHEHQPSPREFRESMQHRELDSLVHERDLAPEVGEEHQDG